MLQRGGIECSAVDEPVPQKRRRTWLARVILIVCFGGFLCESSSAHGPRVLCVRTTVLRGRRNVVIELDV